MPPSLAVTYPFTRQLGSDTIPIALRPAIQVNPFYPAGPLPRSQTSSARDPPDKSLIIRQSDGGAG